MPNRNPNDINPAENSGQAAVKNIIDRESNLGRSNFLGPTARTLFYYGGKLSTELKYGQFLFYSLQRSGDNDFKERYFSSESRDYNSYVSSLKSKNPSAKFLVESSISNFVEASEVTESSNKNTEIIGGHRAPYSWSDFLYCKYYGRIPNNYMITLRRYPTPMLDNLSLPKSVDQTEDSIKGVGKPVAQAVTWFGGDTGNNLNDIISFGAGINWEAKSQREIIDQQGFDRGIFASLPGRLLTQSESVFTGNSDTTISNGVITAMNLILSGTEEGENNITNSKVLYYLREKASEPNGPLSDFPFVSVDSVNKTYVRDVGLSFTDKDINLKFHYELTSVGQVNTKAAMLDILANLLSLGTNDGSFLQPDYRYNNGFPALGFPGGEEGLKKMYTEPLEFFKQLLGQVSGLVDEADENANTAAAKASSQGDVTEIDSVDAFLKFLKELRNIENLSPEAQEALNRGMKKLLSEDYIKSIQMNQSFYTGAPIGEWHLVVGNPMNPIAMIGNLICSNVEISFGDKLGPDDFPTELTATYTLKHGRERVKSEIESMFNRGEGRLYQSTIKTYANTKGFDNRANIGGTFTNNADKDISEKFVQKQDQG